MVVRVPGDGGVGIEVAVEGPQDGTPVLMLHGWPDNHTLWRHQVAALTAAGFRTIAPDLRGFGASDKPEGTEPYKVAHTVVDMLAVLDACSAPQAHVVAHDWGALAGWGLAAFAPDRVTSYTALAVGHPTAFFEAGFEQRMRSLYMVLFTIPDVAEGFLERYGEQLLASHKDRESVLQAWAEPGVMTAGLGWYRANADPRSIIRDAPSLPPVTCPVMGVWASGDLALGEQQMTGSADYVQGSWRYERLDGAGHWMQLDAAEELNALLLEFLTLDR